MSVNSIILEDLEVILAALKKNDLNNANIFCNRLITDGSLNNLRERTIIGAMLKDIIVKSFRFEGKINDLEGIKVKIITLIKNIKNLIKKQEIDYNQIWDLYQKFFSSTREIYLSDYEVKYYKTNPEFTDAITKFCLELLINDIEKINYASVICWGVVSELSRVFTSHGSNSKQLSVLTLINYFARYFDYIRYVVKDNTTLTDENLEKEFQNLKTDLIKIIKMYLKNHDDYQKESSELLFNFCLEWRKMFIRFMDIRPPVKTKRFLELPTEAKEKLKTLVSDTLKKEVTKNE